MTVTDLPPRTDAPAPEALIPEARQHQRRRYSVIAAAVLSAVVALVVALIIVAGPGSNHPSASQVTPPPAALLSSRLPGPVTVRPVDCLAPAYSAVAPAPAHRHPLPTGCPAQYRVGPASPNPSVDGYSYSDGTDDPALATSRTTLSPNRTPNQRVLLGLLGSDSGQRYLLGPVQFVMTPHTIVASATADRAPTGAAEVNIVFTAAGAKKWNAAAKSDFHQELAVVVDGRVVSAALIEPSQHSFTSFDDQSTISGGNLTLHEARQIAATL
jgi:hypothetical protein